MAGAMQVTERPRQVHGVLAHRPGPSIGQLVCLNLCGHFDVTLGAQAEARVITWRVPATFKLLAVTMSSELDGTVSAQDHKLTMETAVDTGAGANILSGNITFFSGTPEAIVLRTNTAESTGSLEFTIGPERDLSYADQDATAITPLGEENAAGGYVRAGGINGAGTGDTHVVYHLWGYFLDHAPETPASDLNKLA